MKETFKKFLKSSIFEVVPNGRTTVRIDRLGGSSRTVPMSNNFADYNPIAREIAERDYHNKYGVDIGKYHAIH